MKRALLGAGALLVVAALWAHGTPAQWAERAQRVPVPWLSSSPPLPAPVAVERASARVLEEADVALDSDVVALAELGDALYAGTFDRGAVRIGRDGGRQALAVDARINDLAAGEEVFAATNGGAYAIAASGRARKLAPGAFSAVAVWQGRPVFAGRGGIAIASGAGLWTIGAEHGLRPDGPSVLLADGAALHIGAADGLWSFDGARVTHRSSASGELPEEAVTALALSEGALWVGTLGSGVARVCTEGAGAGASIADARATTADRRAAIPDPGIPDCRVPLPDGRVTAHGLVATGGALYFGTPSGVVVLRDGRARLLDAYAPVTALAQSARGGLWIGLRGKVVRVEIAQGDQFADVADIGNGSNIADIGRRAAPAPRTARAQAVQAVLVQR